MQGRLLSDYFANEGIKATDEWKESIKFPQDFWNFEETLRTKYRAIMDAKEPNEALTEQELILPVMHALGWQHYIPQQGTDRNQDIPDLILYPNSQSKAEALAQQTHSDRFKNAVAIQENKRLYLKLDTRDTQERSHSASPHGQILRYLAAADDASLGSIRWGILTNGKIWRLYDYRTRPRATAFYEADLRRALDAITTASDYDELRKFYLLFRHKAFTPQEGTTTTFLEKCLAEAKLFEERVAQDISGVVFERVFPNLVSALAKTADVHPAKAHQPALVLLYRILFIMFAEDRGLLPVEHPSYRDYGLRYWLRENERPRGAKLSSQRRNAFLHFRELCRIVDRGDLAIGVPAYNGNLFAEDYAEILETHELPDSEFIPVIRDLSHTNIDGERRYVNYRDMSVQQLGSIYERLLEREPIVDSDGNVKIVLNRHARKDSGSFYTPQPLVDLIVDQTLEPLIEDRLKSFETAAQDLRDAAGTINKRIAKLAEHDPASAVLDLKVLDPAMGSGHFLVTTVDFLADYIADLIEYAPSVPEWADEQYQSPVATQIDTIRKTIKEQATQHGWVVHDSHLSDQAIIRRMVLKRTIYGVDKNPLTVELAKVALWLHSFTVGAPLSFLDHHLRCGDALVGMRTQHATQELNRLGGLFAQSAINSAQKAASAIQRIEDLPDSIIEHVHESRELFNKAERKTAELRGILDFLCGLQWLTAGMTKTAKASFEAPIAAVIEQSNNGAENLLTCLQPTSKSRRNRDTARLFNERRDAVRNAAQTENFLHWEAAFPEVWQNWQDESPTGGFDAVIANPPWDRIKFQEKEWLEQRDPEIAKLPSKAARPAKLNELREQGENLPDDLDHAKLQANLMTRWIRQSGIYPLLGVGDINLYSLFVERAESLIKPDGMVGLLTPAGIYADHTAARFFRNTSTDGRIRGLYDFENRREFFKEVHASFKFCVFAFGGLQRRFTQAKCAFYLRNINEILNPDKVFVIEPRNFALVNPNTGTAPIFRSQRDADITREIYNTLPVLVNRSGPCEQRAWPVRYNRMFDMSNDAVNFRTANALDRDGYDPIAGKRWQKGDNVCLPVYEGKMVQAYNHRAASVVSNVGNVYRPGQTDSATANNLADHGFSPVPRYWIEPDDRTGFKDHEWFLAFKDVTASTNTRTMIAAIVPHVACANTLPLLLGTDESFKAHTAALFLANLNSFALDYATRQKIHGTHLTWYIVEQLPVVPPSGYDFPIGNTTARDLVRDHVLRLTYTAHDIQAFALDIGYAGEPFTWDEVERTHLRARLDALYFILYGISRDDADYILNTFPTVKRDDENLHGRFLTRDLILAYMNCLQAGDTETIVNL